MDKEEVVCACTHIHTHWNMTQLLKKKDEILPFVTTGMDLEDTMLSETSQTEKGKYHTISFIYGI